jgi:hypothetical protein
MIHIYYLVIIQQLYQCLIQLMVRSLKTGLHDFLYTLDTIKSRDASQLFWCKFN